MNLRDLIGKLVGTPKSSIDARTAKYGWGEVSAASVRFVFDEVVAGDLGELGFSHIKDWRYGRQIDDDIIQLLKLKLVKGHEYIFTWGVSLSCVPHQWDSAVKWHRTLKSARLDLFEQGLNVEREADPRLRPGDPNVHIDLSHGNECMREDLVQVWNTLRPHILKWWDQCRTLEGVLSTATYQSNLTWRSFRHFPPQELVTACVLARLGRTAEAEAQFQKVERLPGAGDLTKLRAAVLGITPIR